MSKILSQSPFPPFLPAGDRKQDIAYGTQDVAAEENVPGEVDSFYLRHHFDCFLRV